MINRVVLVGRLTKDPEMKYTASGIAVTNFTVAVNRAFTNQQGERDADFIRVRAWRKQAENVANFLHKGSLCGIDGRIETGSFEGNDGKRVYTFDVIADSVQFLEPKAKDETQGAAPPPQQQPYGQNQGPYGAPPQQPYQQGQQDGYGHYNTDPNAYGPGR